MSTVAYNWTSRNGTPLDSAYFTDSHGDELAGPGGSYSNSFGVAGWGSFWSAGGTYTFEPIWAGPTCGNFVSVTLTVDMFSGYSSRISGP